VAIIEGFNHGLEGVPRDYKEMTLFEQWEEDEAISKQKTIPTSGKISLFIIAFL